MKVENGLSTIGDRIKALRKASGHSRVAFSEKHGIGESTMRSWELNISIVSPRMLGVLFEAFAKEGIFATADWIRTGAPPNPVINNKIMMVEGLRPTSLQDEIDYFVDGTKGRFVTAIEETVFSPFLEKGDLVGGTKINIEDVEHYQGKLCIISDPEQSHKFLVRSLFKDPAKGFFLFSWGPGYLRRSDSIFIDHIEICAPIIWIRKQEAQIPQNKSENLDHCGT